MRRLSVVLTVTLFAVPVSAEDAKPNTLTPKEIADGWLLLFDGETTFGWKAEGEVAVKDGALSLGGAKESKVTFTHPMYIGKFTAEWESSQDGNTWKQEAVRHDSRS